MRAKKIKDISPEVSEEIGESNELVEDLVYFFYSKLRQKLMSIEYPNIQVAGLGIFRSNHKKLYSVIKREEHIYDNCKDEDIKKSMEISINKKKEIYENLNKSYLEKMEYYAERNKLKKDLARKKENS